MLRLAAADAVVAAATADGAAIATAVTLVPVAAASVLLRCLF